jgi:putative transposase
MGTVGDCYDNAVVEAFWARMQVELLNRKKWRTRVELANATFESSRSSTTASAVTRRLGCTPIEYEILHQTLQPAA